MQREVQDRRVAKGEEYRKNENEKNGTRIVQLPLIYRMSRHGPILTSHKFRFMLLVLSIFSASESSLLYIFVCKILWESHMLFKIYTINCKYRAFPTVCDRGDVHKDASLFCVPMFPTLSWINDFLAGSCTTALCQRSQGVLGHESFKQMDKKGRTDFKACTLARPDPVTPFRGFTWNKKCFSSSLQKL